MCGSAIRPNTGWQDIILSACQPVGERLPCHQANSVEIILVLMMVGLIEKLGSAPESYKNKCNQSLFWYDTCVLRSVHVHSHRQRYLTLLLVWSERSWLVALILRRTMSSLLISTAYFTLKVPGFAHIRFLALHPFLSLVKAVMKTIFENKASEKRSRGWQWRWWMDHIKKWEGFSFFFFFRNMWRLRMRSLEMYSNELFLKKIAQNDDDW